MSENENKTLFLDILRPYRKAVSSNSPKPSVSTAATKLNFTDSSISEGYGSIKRKALFESDATPKRSRLDPDPNGSSPIPSSPWELRRLKGDLTEAKTQIARLESQISQQNNIRKEMEVLFETERRGLLDEKKSRERAAADLSERLQVLKDRETQSKEQIAKLTQKLNDVTGVAEREKQQSYMEISQLQSKIIEATYAGTGQASDNQKDIDKITQELESAQKEIEHCETINEKISAEVSRLQAELDVQTVTLKKAEQNVRELEADKESYNEWLQQAKASQKRLATMSGLEREVVNLRSEVRSLRITSHQCQLLEEQVHVLGTKLASLEPLQKNLEVVQAKCIDVEKELGEWRALAVRHEVTKPMMLSEMIEKLQERDLALTSQKVDADSQLARAKDELITAAHERDKATNKLTDIQNIQRTQQSLIHRIQKKLLLVSRERDSYRHQLDCYEKELTVSLGDHHHQAGSGLGALSASRIEALEKTVQGYRDLLAKMEQDMSALKAEASPVIQDQLSRLKEDVISLKMDNEKLRSRKNELEIQLEERALRESEKLKTKLVHMKQNPFALIQENLKSELDKAQAEVMKLRKKLEANELELTQRLSEESIRGGGATTAQEIEELRSKLESEKLICKRLKEVFTTSIDGFKNAFYMLLGYTMDRTSPNNYKLTNVYAESENDYLSFTITDEGQIEMKQTEYATQINDLVELHLHRQKSIPVFLSSLTINLYNKTTMCQDSTLQATLG